MNDKARRAPGPEIQRHNMGTTLSTLAPPRGAKHAQKRRGRGQGSGQGTTGGRGEKGQGARSGGSTGPGFEGGQMPLQRRLPKRGFKNPFRVEYVAVNVGMLGEKFTAGQMVDPGAIQGSGLAPRKGGLLLKVLGEGEIKHALTVKAHAFSKSAAEKIQAAGGSVEVIPTKARRVAEQAAGSSKE
jgi:large subunit ribosomal protein L15